MNLLKKMTILLSAGFFFVSCSDSDSTEGMININAKLVVTSNTSGMATFYDFTNSNDVQANALALTSTDVDGVYFDSSSNELIVGSRSNNQVEVYSNSDNSFLSVNATLSLSINSSSDFSNNREIAVSGNKIIVVQDANTANGDSNKLLVYTKSGSSITLSNTYDVAFNLWGIHIEGNTLYAIEDNTSKLSVFENFFANTDGAITATKSVAIEGIIRTHGITYSAADDVMVLTDVAEASSDVDGGLVVISNFSTVLNATSNGATISAANFNRISGSASTLGNPVDVAYDNVSGNIYVAERANAGGQILVFDKPTSSGDVAPKYSANVAGASAVYFSRN